MGACLSSKSRRTHVHDSKQAESDPASAGGELLAQQQPQQPQEEQQEEQEQEEQEQEQEAVAKIYIIFYSMYGHVEALAKRVKAGVDSVEGAEGVLYRVPETLPQEVLDKMQPPGTDDSIPVIDVLQLPSADGFLFGFPTRYGAMAAQMKAFFDSTGKLWSSQQLAGKPAGFFVSTGSQGGGQETTAWTAITQLAHHGMLYVPVGYTFGAGVFSLDELRGGSPYGAGTYAGQGSRQPSEAELQLAEHQGSYTAEKSHILMPLTKE